jgi:hypothetical protein
MTDTDIDALLRRHDQDSRRLQWLLRLLVVIASGLVALAWLVPLSA